MSFFSVFFRFFSESVRFGQIFVFENENENV